MVDDRAGLPKREPTPLHPIEKIGQVSALPRPLTSFIGRESEISAVRVMLDDDGTRLLTLTGPGGVGKSRLALEVAQRARERFHHTWYVALAAVRNAALVGSTIGHELGFTTAVDQTLAREIRLLLGDRTALLVLDNFEQVLAAGALVANLLSTCPTLTVLVTSRAPLRVSGEHLHPVPPMALPGGQHGSVFDETDAVRLFVERVAEQGAGFTLTPGNTSTVVDICRRLDGLPLAIELAAARVGAFSPWTILDRLDQRLSLLTDGPRDQPARLRSLRDSIAWSHDLLSHDEQVLFRRLAVFLGGWTLDAAEAIVNGADEDAALPVLEGIASLVGKSLIRQETRPDGESRYVMLETIREFARERLEMGGDEAGVRDRHAAYYLHLAERAEWSWLEPLATGEAQLAQLELEHANFRTALDWFHQIGDARSLALLVCALKPLWFVCGHCHEGQLWLERSLEHRGALSDTTCAMVLAALSWATSLQGEPAKALAFAGEGLVIFRAVHHRIGAIHCLVLGGMTARQLGDVDGAIDRLREALLLLADLDGPAWTRNFILSLHGGLGHTAIAQGEIQQAEHHYHRALDLQAAEGYAPGASHIYGNHILAGLGDVARAQGRQRDAVSWYRNCLELAWRNHDIRSAVNALGGMAGSLAALGRHDDAARLFGASEALHASYGYRFDLETFDRQRAFGLPEPWARAQEVCGIWQRLRDAVRSQYPLCLASIADVRAVSDQWEAGGRLPLADAVAEALAIDLRPARADRIAEPTLPEAARDLTPRELEVLKFMADGLTNQQIADALFISHRTVARHSVNILGKLDLSSRTSAVAYAIRHGLA